MSNLKQMKKFAKMNICSFTFESITWCKITNKKNQMDFLQLLKD